jgi:hypothetical protein
MITLSTEKNINVLVNGCDGTELIKPDAPRSLVAEKVLELLKPDAPRSLVADIKDVGVITQKGDYKGYVFNSRTESLSGPFVGEQVTTLTTKDNSSEMYCVNKSGEVKKTDLLEFNNPYFKTFADPFTEINTSFDPTEQEGVILSEKGLGFAYRGKYLAKPFEEPVDGGGVVEEPLFFRNCYLSNAETNWMHLGDEHNEKQLYRIDMKFHKNSCGHLWVYIRNDEGIVKGQYKGAIKEHIKVFSNLRGRAFRIQILVATHYDHPWAMREMAVGHLYGKSF